MKKKFVVCVLLFFLVVFSGGGISHAQKNTSFLEVQFSADPGNLGGAAASTNYQEFTGALTNIMLLNLELGLLMPNYRSFEVKIGLSGKLLVLPGNFDEERQVRNLTAQVSFEYLYLGFSFANGIFETVFYSAPYQPWQHSYTGGVEHRNIVRWFRRSFGVHHIGFSSTISFDWIVNSQIQSFFYKDPFKDPNAKVSDLNNLWNPINHLSWMRLEYQYKFGAGGKYELLAYFDMFSRDIYFNYDPISLLFGFDLKFHIGGGFKFFISSSLQLNFLDDPRYWNPSSNALVSNGSISSSSYKVFTEALDWRIQLGMIFRADIFEF